MRLRNRMTKATFWTDGELLRWPRDKRFFYKSLWCMAEDSCCIEDDPFEWKLTAWASPLDADITIEQLCQWRDELIECGKAVRYRHGNKAYLYLPLMAAHEKPRNPQAADLPLPPWVVCNTAGSGKSRRVEYVHGDCDASVQKSCGNRDDTLDTDCGSREGSPVLSSPEQSSPVQSCPVQSRAVRANNLPPCLSKTFDGTKWSASDGVLHETPAQAFWSTVETASNQLVTPNVSGLLCSMIADTCPAGCDKSEDAVSACLDVLIKAAEKTKGKPSPLFRRICEEDR